MKTCTKCHEAKPFDQYHQHKGGLRPDCKECRCLRVRLKYRQDNPLPPAAAARAGPRTYTEAQKQRKRQQWADHYRRKRQARLAHYREETAQLTEAYVRKKLARDTCLKPDEVPQALVNLKREHLRLARALKEAERHEDC